MRRDEPVCPYCGGPLSNGRPVGICPICETPHHQDCWQANRGCTTLGCLANPQTGGFSSQSLTNVRVISAGEVSVPGTPTEPVVIPPRPSPFGRGLIAAIVVGMIVLGCFWVGVSGLGWLRQGISNISSQSTPMTPAIGQTVAAAVQHLATATPTRHSLSPTPTQRRPTQGRPTNTPSPQPPKGRVNTAKLNVRKGPGTEYDIITQITDGTRVKIIGTNPGRTWWRVRLSNGTVGWAHGEYIDESGCVDCVQVSHIPSTPTPKPKPEWQLITSSTEDFSGNQEFKHWAYLWEGDGGRDSFNWRPLPVFDGTCWRTGTWENDVRICKHDAHPGWSTNIARLWKSPVSGEILIEIHAHKIDTDGGDGVSVEVFKGTARLKQHKLNARDSKGFTDRFTANVTSDDLLFFVIKIRGNSAYDHTALEISIYQRPE